MQFRRYTQEQFIEAIKTSDSICEALRKLNVAAFGGNYAVAHKYIKLLELDISHMHQQAWAKDKKFGPKRPIEDYLSNKQTITTHALRKRLLEEKIFEHQCSNCTNKEWLDRPIPLELDHIDGNNKNNNLTNIRLLCPNCHALTINYRGKNRKPYPKK